MPQPLTDRDLVRLYWPVHLRPAFDALFAIDDALGEVVASSTQPALGAVKLAWWREALERLDATRAPPEPRLREVKANLLPVGIAGAELARIEDGWATLLEERPDEERIGRRGALLFDFGARLLGHSGANVGEAGPFWARVDVARRLGRLLPAEAVRITSEAPLRPLTMLAALAVRDIRRGVPEAEATPGRALALMKHCLTGR